MGPWLQEGPLLVQVLVQVVPWQVVAATQLRCRWQSSGQQSRRG